MYQQKQPPVELTSTENAPLSAKEDIEFKVTGSAHKQLPSRQTLESLDIAEQKRLQLKQLFPEVFNEEKVDFERLQRVLGEQIDTGKERYGLTWPGKANCMKVIQEPSRATLKPCREESVDFDNTENLFIEGDNLEVLKLLQKSYFGKVKMIYIDPPYNTGKEFIYPDNYQETIETYMAYAGLVDDEGKKFSTNTATEGRFHSKWLNMMYPRLYLAKNLLREDGVIFISIDDHELENLYQLCNEIFGKENFLANFPRVTKKAGKSTDSVAKNNDHLLCYRKTHAATFQTYAHTDDGFKHTDKHFSSRGKYKLNQTLDYGSIQYSPSLDYEIKIEGHTLRPGNVTKEQMLHRQQRNPKSDFCWRWSKELFEYGLHHDFIVLKEGRNGLRIYTKTYEKATIKKVGDEYKVINEERTAAISSLNFTENEYSNDNSRKDLAKIFEGKLFEYSKPVSLLEEICFLGTAQDDIILDFFAGSSTTAHAAMKLNSKDHGNRKFIMIQLPEECGKTTEAFNAGYKNIANISKERIRRAAKKVAEEAENTDQLDLGFRVYKLNKSHFGQWQSEIEPGNVAQLQANLELHSNHIAEDAEQEALLYELLLKAGFELTESIEQQTFVNQQAFSVAEGALLICLEDRIEPETLEAMVKAEPAEIIVKDSAFAGNDQLKVNAVQTVKAYNQNSETDIVFKVV